ncbi:ferredoxin [Halobacteriales archaeon QH_7_66_36]|nr:MAG: ferredoxin [Halobacteriales archaeon QH_7_66_36]
MTTEYAIRLDRDACDGVFACLVRDDRFVESEDGLAAIADTATEETTVARFDDDRLAAAEGAAAACPLDAIKVEVVGDE